MTARAQGRTVESPYAPVWVGVRVVLALTYVLLLLAGIVLHRGEAQLRDLYADVERGAVSRVVVSGGALEPGATGSASYDVSWSTGGRRWSVDVVQERPDPDSSGGFTSEGDGERTADDVVQELRRRDPSVEVVRKDLGGWIVTTLDVRLPGVLGIPWVVAVLAGLILMIGGPEPWRATRWAWFWLAMIPGALLVWLVRSGPTPRLSLPPTQDVRLTGGRAFAVAAVGSVVANAAVALLVAGVWPTHG